MLFAALPPITFILLTCLIIAIMSIADGLRSELVQQPIVCSYSAFSVAIVIILALWYLIEYYGEKRSILSNGKYLVRPARWPIFGIAYGLTPENMIAVLEDYHRRYGNFIELYLGPQKFLLISDIEITKELLNIRPKILRRIRCLDYPAKQVGYSKSLFFANGIDWYAAHRLTAPAFNKENVANHILDIWQSASQWVEDLKTSSHSTPVIEFRFKAMDYTLRVITQLAFGINRREDDSSTVMDSYVRQSIFVEDVKHLFAFFMEAIIFPLPTFIWKMSPWHYDRYEVPAMEGDQRLRQACAEFIQREKNKTQEKRTTASSSSMSLLATLLKKAQTDQLSDDEVIENIKLFFLAGSETTSVGISFAAYYLALYPDIKSTVRDEVDRFSSFMDDCVKRVAGEDCDANLYEEVLNRLPLTEAVFKESLRLQPPSTFMAFETESGSHTLSNGLTIGPNDQVAVFYEGMLHGINSNWENPNKFDPSRWLDPDPKKREQLEYQYVAFGGGPRVCPGKKLAMMKGILAIASLVHHLDWSLACEPHEVKRVMLVTSIPNQMPLKFTSRHHGTD